MIDVVSLPDALFTSQLWTNRQHMALALARSGRARVLYVEPGRFRSGPSIDKAQPGMEAPPGRTPRGVVEVADGLAVLRTRLPVPYKVALRASPTRVTAFLARRASFVSRRMGFDAPVIWSYTPLGWYFRDHFPAAPLVYDLVDDYLTQSNYSKLSLGAAHDGLLRAAQLVFCTTESLRDRAMATGARRVEVMGNAADVDLFALARGLVGTAEPCRPYLLFWGAVTAEKLDIPTIAELSRRLAGNIDLVFVGPTTHEVCSALRSLPNVRLFAARKPKDLVPLIAGSLACFIPYRQSAYTKSISALKLYEAFAAGKQVIISNIPAAREVSEHVWTARSVQEWEDAIHRIRLGGRRPAPLDIRVHSWDHKAARCIDQIEDHLASGGSLPGHGGQR